MICRSAGFEEVKGQYESKRWSHRKWRDGESSVVTWQSRLHFSACYSDAQGILLFNSICCCHLTFLLINVTPS